MPDITVAAAMAGFMPAKKHIENEKIYLLSQDIGKPVDLNMAPVTAPAAMLPIASCFPLIASIEELTPLYKRAIKRAVSMGLK
jgi:hypothetical protein